MPRKNANHAPYNADDWNEWPGSDTTVYTRLPNDVIDYLMCDLTGAELKVLLYIVRRTIGFDKDADGISIKQFCQGITKKDGTRLDRGTGLSHAAVSKALQSLIAKNVIVYDEGGWDKYGHRLATLYTLRNEWHELLEQPA